MRVGFDVTPVSDRNSGVGMYAANLLAHLQAQANGQDEIVPLAHFLPGDSRDTARGLNKTLWMQTVLPRELARRQINLCHFTNSVATLLSPCSTIVTIHDMTLWLFPQHHYRRRLLTMRPFIPLAVRRAAAVIAVSHATKTDLVRILGVPSHKVHVIHEAPAPWFRPLAADEAVLEQARQRYQLPARFVLYVGTLEPRKNLVRLVEAFAQLPRDVAASCQLLLVGQPGWKHEPIFAAVERLGIEKNVRFLGYVPSEMLAALYNLADLLAFPSLYEGFGLPVVEAMACGAPVLTSHNSALAEVVAGAAELVDPLEVESIAHGLHHLLADEERRARLRAQGLARVAQFTWSEAAARTWALYQRVV